MLSSIEAVLKSAAAAAAEAASGGEAPPANPDDELTVLDGSMDVGRKMKRAFCEPGNVADCPPLVGNILHDFSDRMREIVLLPEY